mmetsp:Transcript_42226/g.100136  ORF Transcript_42226/g.100136 Transcript_42226/m.100136 type:complete len:217 (-) Transcript_42226:1402-2052(-)
MVSYLFWSFSTLSSRSLSSSVTRWRSSRTSFSSALRPSRWTCTSCLRSSIDCLSWYLRFSRLNTSSALRLRIPRSLSSSSLSPSCSTILSSFALFACSRLRDPLSLMSRISWICSWSFLLSALTDPLRLRALSRASSTSLTCSVSMLCSVLTPSSCAVSFSIRALSARFSSSVRSPAARCTLRSSCCTWNSALYRSSCCFTTCASCLEMLATRFLF